MSYWIWIPLLAVVLALNAWFTVKNQQQGGWYLFATMLPLVSIVWAFISKYSKNLVLDYIIFDIELMAVFTLSLITFTGSWSKITCFQYIGFGIILLGMLIFRK